MHATPGANELIVGVPNSVEVLEIVVIESESCLSDPAFRHHAPSQDRKALLLERHVTRLCARRTPHKSNAITGTDLVQGFPEQQRDTEDLYQKEDRVVVRPC